MGSRSFGWALHHRDISNVGRVRRAVFFQAYRMRLVLKGHGLKVVLAQLKPGRYVFQYLGSRSIHVDPLMYYQDYLISISGRP